MRAVVAPSRFVGFARVDVGVGLCDEKRNRVEHPHPNVFERQPQHMAARRLVGGRIKAGDALQNFNRRRVPVKMHHDRARLAHVGLLFELRVREHRSQRNGERARDTFLGAQVEVFAE